MAAQHVNPKRICILKDGAQNKGPVLYWMDRERRVHDNWALLFAQEKALELKTDLLVIYCIPKHFLNSCWRQYSFMIEGLKEIQQELLSYQIPFQILLGNPEVEVPNFIEKNHVSHLITDMSPLRIPRAWRDDLKQSLNIPFYEVDARNIVPVWEASQKLEFAAYTIRPKIHKKLSEFLTDFPKLELQKPQKKWPFKEVNMKEIKSFIQVDETAAPISWLSPGEKAGKKTLKDFLSHKITMYSSLRNNPNENGTSNLSPYLHFGQISAQRVALMSLADDDFIEELIVRRELADNFCFYNPNYDRFEGFHPWAQKTLNEHRFDPRDYLYELKDFEAAKTHDPLWNAAQSQMLSEGKMHGYLRMYWAKKILEWSASPEDALRISIYLNDKYELDGRDPNGYTGCAWSIGGVHDRAWGERPVFGKIRYMSTSGCKRKFNVPEYIERYALSPTPLFKR